MIIVRILTFTALTYTLLLVLGGMTQIIGLPVEVGLPQLSPGFAGMLMVQIFPDDRHHMTFVDPTAPIGRYIVAAAIPLCAGLVAYFLCQDVTPDDSESSGVSSNLLLFFVLTPIGAFGEEIGWRGYLHKRLESEGFRGIMSSLIVGIIWTGIHIPMMIHGGSVLFTAVYGALVIFLATSIYAVVQDTDFSIVIATIFHAALNWTNFLYVDRIYMVKVMEIVASVWFVVAIACVVVRRNLYLAPKGTLQSRYPAVSEEPKRD